MGIVEGKFKFPVLITTNSAKETMDFAKELGEIITPFELIAFFGDLGAGKTAFIKGFARSFGVEEYVCSPTFSIVNEYIYDGLKKIVHCDMYRIFDEEELYGAGYFDMLKDKNAIVLIEWSENIKNFLPKSYIKVKIDVLDENKRKISVSREID